MSAAAARTHVLLAAVLFGTTGTAQALGPHVEPVVLGAARILIGAALLAGFALAGAGARRIGAGRGAVGLAGACVAVYQATFFAALSETGVAVGTVVAIGSAPAFAGLFARLFAGEPLRGRWAAATALACAGVALRVSTRVAIAFDASCTPLVNAKAKTNTSAIANAVVTSCPDG